ncbi:MAG TPA: hypothetical protein VIM30_16150 [Candidatus Limnocylindrales bacterium]|jgi:hypothetical protein
MTSDPSTSDTSDQELSDAAASSDTHAEGEVIDSTPAILPPIAVRQGGIGIVEATTVNVSQGGILAARAGEITISQGGVGGALTGKLELSQGGAGTVFAGDARIEQSFVRTLIARDVVVEGRSGVLFLVARHVEGDVRALMDWRGALAFGAALGLVAGLMRGGRRRR